MWLGKYQCGFRNDRTVVDQIFTLKQVQDYAYRHKVYLYVLFIDIKQAYDVISRNELYKSAESLQVPVKLTNVKTLTTEHSESE